LSSVDDTPGQMLIEAISYSVNKFILNTNSNDMSNCFSPAIPVSTDEYFGEI